MQSLAVLPPQPVAVDSATQITTSLIALGLLWGGRVLGVLLVMLAAWIAARWGSRTICLLLQRARFDPTVISFFSNLARWTVLLLGLVACLSIFGINIAAVTAVIGAAGLAIGLAMQGSLSNLAAGIMLMILRPFRVGDGVTVAGQTGRVHDIDLFNTKLDTVDNRRLIVPNSAIFNATIENATHHPRRRVEVSVRAPMSSDPDRIRALLHAAVESVPQRLPELPFEIVMTDMGNTRMLWAIRMWAPTSEFRIARDALLVAVKKRLDEESARQRLTPAPTPAPAQPSRESHA
ncbi:MAG: mechanosensitive ion channel family protein [Phycisphaerae bacterium]|nr:mechanosensitive ion channel family protein [Phycisphaerae bacterium]